jgi:hypothetical protein
VSRRNEPSYMRFRRARLVSLSGVLRPRAFVASSRERQKRKTQRQSRESHAPLRVFPPLRQKWRGGRAHTQSRRAVCCSATQMTTFLQKDRFVVRGEFLLDAGLKLSEVRGLSAPALQQLRIVLSEFLPSLPRNSGTRCCPRWDEGIVRLAPETSWPSRLTCG